MPYMDSCTVYNVCMYVCIYVCMYVCMYSNGQNFIMRYVDITFKVSRIGRTSYDHSGASLFLFVIFSFCMYVCMYVCMYLCRTRVSKTRIVSSSMISSPVH